MKSKLTEDGHVHHTAIISNVVLGKWCEIGPFSILENTEIDDYSYCGSNCIFQNTKIKKFSNIAANVRIGATDHPIDRPSLHHFTYRSLQYGLYHENDKAFLNERKNKITVVGHDTWIGHGALLKNGISVGNGAVVGQGAVVTKDVPPYAIVAGVPAKIIRFRFSEEQVNALIRIAWWEWDYEKIKDHFMDFRGSMDAFIEKHDQSMIGD